MGDLMGFGIGRNGETVVRAKYIDHDQTQNGPIPCNLPERPPWSPLKCNTSRCCCTFELRADNFDGCYI